MEGGPLASRSRSPGRESTQRLCTCFILNQDSGLLTIFGEHTKCYIHHNFSKLRVTCLSNNWLTCLFELYFKFGTAEFCMFYNTCHNNFNFELPHWLLYFNFLLGLFVDKK